MPLFQIDVEKEAFGNFWTNRYFVTSTSIENAHEGAEVIWNFEAAIHREDITIVKARTRTTTVGDDVFIVEPLALPGGIPPSGAFMPLWNVVRVDIKVAGFGRPSRKFYRVGLCAGDQIPGFSIDASLVSIIQGEMDNLVPNTNAVGAFLCDADTDLWDIPTVFSTIAMRQLRRGSRRPTLPVL